MDYQLRAASELDKSFLYRLHCLTMRNLIEKTWGWDEEWQRSDFETRFGQRVVSIIEIGGLSAGSLWLENRPDSLYVADLQVSPEWQRRGVGTAVLHEIIGRAASRGLNVELEVLQFNEGARRLYERLGFRVTAVGVPVIRMRYESAAGETLRDSAPP